MYRFERREKKLQSKRSKMLKHGKGLGKMYADAVTKQVKKSKERHIPLGIPREKR